MMTVNQLRLRLFGIWLAFWVLSLVLITLAPLIRRDNKIHFDDLDDVIVQTSVLWLPVLGCFVGFWFPKEERRRASRRVADTDQKIASLSITIVHVSLSLVCVAIPLYVLDYKPNSDGYLEAGKTLVERVVSWLKVSILTAPLAAGIVTYYTVVTDVVSRREKGTS